VFTLAFTYQVPGINVPAQLLKGWEINSIVSILSAQPYNASDGSDDFSGTGELNDRWSITGDPANIHSGVGVSPIPCFGVPGSAFAGTTNCSTVAAGTGSPGSATYVANMPATCVTLAASENNPKGVALSTNPNVPTTDPNFNGYAALASNGCYYENGTAIVPPAQGTFGNMGRNVLRNSNPFREWDFSIAKNFLLTERLKAQFRAEFFNVTNKPIFSSPSGGVNSPSSFGASTSLNNSGDPILGAGGPRQINLSLRFTF
jgi:hypothetical protein